MGEKGSLVEKGERGEGKGESERGEREGEKGRKKAERKARRGMEGERGEWIKGGREGGVEKREEMEVE